MVDFGIKKSHLEFEIYSKWLLNFVVFMAKKLCN